MRNGVTRGRSAGEFVGGSIAGRAAGPARVSGPGNHSKYARLETGEKVPSPGDVAAILATLGAPEAERERLVEMATDAEEGNWLKSGSLSPSEELTALMEFERTATGIVDVSPILVPGLFQTADYARSIMTGKPPGEIEARVAMRVGRRDVLSRRHAPRVTAIIMEGALHEPIGGPSVMIDQLRHIVKMAEMEAVTVRVLRGGSRIWTPAHAGPFILFEFPKAAPVVHLEHLSSSAFLSAASDIKTYREAVANLDAMAMGVSESTAFIARCAEDMEDSQG